MWATSNEGPPPLGVWPINYSRGEVLDTSYGDDADNTYCHGVCVVVVAQLLLHVWKRRFFFQEYVCYWINSIWGGRLRTNSWSYNINYYYNCRIRDHSESELLVLVIRLVVVASYHSNFNPSICYLPTKVKFITVERWSPRRILA